MPFLLSTDEFKMILLLLKQFSWLYRISVKSDIPKKLMALSIERPAFQFEIIIPKA